MGMRACPELDGDEKVFRANGQVGECAALYAAVPLLVEAFGERVPYKDAAGARQRRHDDRRRRFPTREAKHVRYFCSLGSEAMGAFESPHGAARVDVVQD